MTALPGARSGQSSTDRLSGTRAALTTALSLDGAQTPAGWRTEARPRVASPAPAAARRGRSLAGYLLMPRPGDTVKALLMPLTFGLGVLANGGTDGRNLARALLVLVVLEFLVYPARYQWNDVRGFAADQRHPGESDRGRLPGPLTKARQRVIASAVVAALRLIVAGLLAVVPGLDLGGFVLAVIVGVFGVAAAYEALRASATGRHGGDASPPVTPALALLWVTVGAGYAVRGMIGLALVMDLRADPALGLAAAVTLWSYGVAFVTSRWAVESIAFARLHGQRVTWSADASHAREHLLALTRWLPARADVESLDRWAVLRTGTPTSAPWNVAVSVAGAAATITGLLLSGAAADPAIWLVAAVGGTASLVVARLPGSRTLLVGAGAVALFAASTALAPPHPMVALLPWLAVMAAYAHFSAQSLATMGHLGRAVRSAVGRVLTPLSRLVVGHQTWEVLTSGSSARG
jgi:hypothetical protein